MKELSVFKTGKPNDAFAKYFIGQSYLNMLSTEQVGIGNVTFEPGCRNNWHIHQIPMRVMRQRQWQTIGESQE